MSLGLLFSLFTCAPLQVSPCPTDVWFDALPPSLESSILWRGDHEEGTLFDWDYGGGGNAGGGIFNTGGMQVSASTVTSPVHSGSFAARAWISNAWQVQNGSRAVRLMRWTDTAWNLGGDYFPDEAYYSAWFYFPHTYNPNKYAPWDPGDGGWWNIFQFKCNDAAGVSQPMFTVNVWHDDMTGEMSLYAYTKENTPSSYDQIGPETVTLPVGRWVHLEAFYKASTTNAGEFVLWQDGVKIIEALNVKTILPGDAEKPVWGVGNYTDHIDGGPTPGSATIFIDDAAVSTQRLGQVQSPWTHLGGGHSTVGATPRFEASGTLEADSLARFSIASATPNTLTFFVFGTSALNLPLFGGQLVPSTELIVAAPVDPAGESLYCVATPSTLSGAMLWAQGWVLEATGPLAFSSTNAVRGVAP